MAELTVRSDSGEMPGSDELQKWADKFRDQHRIYPLEMRTRNGTVWLSEARGYHPACKYRLTEEAKEILRTVEAEPKGDPEDERKQPDAHLARVFAEIRRLADQAERQVEVELEHVKQELNEAKADAKRLLSERDTARDALEESLESEKRSLSERDAAKDAADRYYAKAEERQAELVQLTRSLESASSVLSERDRLAINMNSKRWLLRQLVLRLLGVVRK